ncbi:prolyl oligopeptidase family serine peptidase [Peptoniphilus sp. AGMB00490]|uniref:Prolyl oligopeptidase family serine peptidase n=2 Tax=Peptoniphilus faecalis TaxID=2731255 RepID=A0A848RM23_9FIRM|nr:prolyl oligopeptidase family serine peptidase [Peptoniphilus faecalis]
MEYLKMNYSDINKINIGEVPAIIIEPNLKTNKTIVFYHGWGSCKENQIFRGNIFASYGYRVILPDARYHGERNNIDLDYTAEDIEAKYILKVIMHNIEEAPSIFKFIEENYPENEIAVGGHSMGAITAGGLYNFKKDLKMAFVYNGINDWHALVDALNKIKKEEKIDENEFRINEFFLDMNPMDSPENFKDRPIVLYNGEDDDIIDPAGQESFARKIEKFYSDKKLLDFQTFEATSHQVTTQMLEASIIFSKEIVGF